MLKSPRSPRFRWLRSPISPISPIGGRRISPITQISLVILGIFLPLALLGLWLGREKAIASWFDDSFAYRNSIAITSHTAAESNVYISTTIDTSASGQFQSDCGDLRFTDYAGNLLPYYISSGCATATTVIHIFFQSFPAGAQTIYYYYGNPSADNGFSAADFPTEATGYVIGAIGSQEKGGAPVAYWKFDDATGTNAQDSSPNNNDGTITGATWQTEDQCVAGKCLSFDGTNDVVTVASSVAGVQTVSFWVRPITTTEQFVDLNGTAYISATAGALSATGFTSPTIYVNGNASTTLSANRWQYISVTTASGLTGSAIKVGQISTNYGQAFIDDIKIYNYARTAAQVKADFASRGSSKGVTLRTQGDTLSNGLVGYWKMDEASANSCTGGVNDSCDSSGNANNGAWNGDATTTAGKFGNGTTFDGTGDYIAASSVTYGSTTTIAGWMKLSSNNCNGTYGVLLSNGSSFQNGIYVYGSTTCDYVAFRGNSGSELDSAYANGLSYDFSQWHQFVGVSDGTRGYVYIDGVQVASNTSRFVVPSVTSAGIDFGHAKGYAGRYLTGSLDDVRIYNRALSPKEVRDLYNWAPGPVGYWNFEEGSGQSANDTSGNGNTGTATGTTIVSGKYGKARSFNGSSDYINMGNGSSLSFGTGNFSVGFWMKSTQISGTYRLLAKRNLYNGDGFDVGYEIYLSNGTVKGFMGDGTSHVAFNNSSATNFADGSWHYVEAVVTRSGNGNIYKDGVLNGGDSVSGQSGSINNSTNMIIGGSSKGTPDGLYSGQLDDVRIYNYARTPAQIAWDYNRGAPVGHWKFDECQGATVSSSGLTGGSSLNGTITIGASGTQTSVGNCSTSATTAWYSGRTGKYNSSLNYDGTDNYVNIGTPSSLNLTSTMTISAWVNTASTGGWRDIVSHGANGYLLGLNNPDNKVFFGVQNGTSVISNNVINTGSWNHVVATYDGTTNIYISMEN